MVTLPRVERPFDRPATSIYGCTPAHPGFFTLGGPDGSGKTTQAIMLLEALRSQGIDAVITREPGGTYVGDDIRTVLLHGHEMSVAAEAALFTAARFESVERIIKPNLAEGRVVISDRFAAATDAYQLHARNRYDLAAWVHEAHEAMGIKPGRTYALVGDPAAFFERMGRRVDGLDRIEAADLAFHERTLEGYLLHAQENPEVKLIDAGRAPEEVHEEILEDAVAHLSAHGYLSR